MIWISNTIYATNLKYLFQKCVCIMYIFHNDLSTSVSTIISLNIACTLKGFNCEWIPRVLLSWNVNTLWILCVAYSTPQCLLGESEIASLRSTNIHQACTPCELLFQCTIGSIAIAIAMLTAVAYVAHVAHVAYIHWILDIIQLNLFQHCPDLPASIRSIPLVLKQIHFWDAL